MKLIVGLGNPELRYHGTRHNIGFHTVDQLAARQGITFTKGKGNFHTARFTHRGETIIIIKPMTYMNHSGHAVIAAMNFNKISRNDLLVLSDDLNIPIGTIRIRAKGSAGGQNGLKHIIECLGSNEFARLRIGIGTQETPPCSFSSFVLGKFTHDEQAIIEKVTPVCCDAILDFATRGISYTMNTYNQPIA